MDIYHFVSYSDQFSLTEYIKKSDAGTILCFDLEDSIQNIENPLKNSALKSSHRNYLKNILKQNENITQDLKIGIRINACSSKEQKKDLELLAELGFIQSVFIPKVENINQLHDIMLQLDQSKVRYAEIVPVIESRSGMQNLELIAKMNSSKIRSIAFGHCDYNLDCGIFPFFHQTSREYWSWVEYMASVIKRYDLNFVNSPFLELNNGEGLRSILSGLRFLCGNKFGQVVLTFMQAKLCAEFDDPGLPAFRTFPGRLVLNVEFDKAEMFRENFRNNVFDKPFSIVGKNKILLSPQEYRAAESLLKKKQLHAFNFTFIGGCFPVQGSILFEKLFHQQVKRNIEKKYPVNFNVQIIRYDRFNECFEKIKSVTESQHIDSMIFCIRPEPVLQRTRFSHRFIDKHGKMKRNYHLPFRKFLFPEIHDPVSSSIVNADKKQSRKSGFWPNLNYLLGMFLGHNRVAMHDYLKLVKSVIKLAQQQNIPLIIMGPALRTDRAMEEFISLRLEDFMKTHLHIDDVHYIRGSDRVKNGVSLFNENGIHANEHYHGLIARRIYSRIEKDVLNSVLNNEHLIHEEEAL